MGNNVLKIYVYAIEIIVEQRSRYYNLHDIFVFRKVDMTEHSCERMLGANDVCRLCVEGIRSNGVYSTHIEEL